MAAVEVAAAIIRQDHRVLACRRRADQPHPHKSGIPQSAFSLNGLR
jgi:hypothetical protein